MIQIALQEENDDADKSEAADGQWHPKPMINSLSSHSIFCRSADSTRIKTISDLVPTRIGVVLYEEAGEGALGHRVGLSLDQIKKLIEQESAAQTGKP